MNKSTAKQVLMFCYHDLPTKNRSCLLYPTVYPKGHVIRSTSLARRWIAEGLITTNDGVLKATDEAERYLNVIVSLEGSFILLRSVLRATSKASQYMTKFVNSLP